MRTGSKPFRKKKLKGPFCINPPITDVRKECALNLMRLCKSYVYKYQYTEQRSHITNNNTNFMPGNV